MKVIVSLLVLCRFVHDAGAMRDTARSSGNQQFDRQDISLTNPVTPFDDTDLPPIGSHLSSSRNHRVSPNTNGGTLTFKGFHFEHLRAPNTPKRVFRGEHFTTFGRAINLRVWSDLCNDIDTLKYTNVPLIGLSPPVRTIKAAFHTAPKSLLTGTPFK
ncbi:hypothetical protein ALC57_07067 [Trachymyrmex cornetzi]|uniref:Uncharacterized protein n=1 Tax=Trachymyrmex cornetzi TaxID=471704 RepID=A0A195E5Y5_9HYME|nr:hypothetical protein ALC57_07067 [Trachymyrmex cornetzi]